MPKLSAEQLTALLNEARLFQAELARAAACEKADAEIDPQRRLDARRRVVGDGFTWARGDFGAAEVDLLYGMAREAARIALARRSTSFCARFGIELTCGDGLAAASPPST